MSAKNNAKGWINIQLKKEKLQIIMKKFADEIFVFIMQLMHQLPVSFILRRNRKV